MLIITFKGEPDAPLILAFNTIFLFPSNVKVFSAPDAFEIALLTVITPALLSESSVPVEILTLLLTNADEISEANMLDVALAVKEFP